MATAETTVTLTLTPKEASAILKVVGKFTQEGTGETSRVYDALSNELHGDMRHQSWIEENDSGGKYVVVGDREF